MDSLINALASENGWLVALLCIIVVILVIMGARAGLFSLKTDKILIGKDARETEQKVIRHQIEYAKTAIEGTERDIPHADDYNEFRAKFILEKCYDEVIKWIIQNHIDCSETYMSIKEDMIVNIIKKHTESEIYNTEEFYDKVRKSVDEMIKRLVQIRETYSKEDQ